MTGLNRQVHCLRNEQSKLAQLRKYDVEEKVLVFRDDSPDYWKYLTDKIKKLHSDGKIYTKSNEVFVCKCGHQVENIGVNVEKCNSCGVSNAFVVSDADTLFLKMPEDKGALIDKKTNWL